MARDEESVGILLTLEFACHDVAAEDGAAAGLTARVAFSYAAEGIRYIGEISVSMSLED